MAASASAKVIHLSFDLDGAFENEKAMAITGIKKNCQRSFCIVNLLFLSAKLNA